MLFPEMLVQTDLPTKFLGTLFTVIFRRILTVDIVDVVIHSLSTVVHLRAMRTLVLSMNFARRR